MKKEQLTFVTHQLIENMPAFMLEMAYNPGLANLHSSLSTRIDGILKSYNASDGSWSKDVLKTSISYIEKILKEEDELDSETRIKLNQLINKAKPIYENIKYVADGKASKEVKRKGYNLATKLHQEDFKVIFKD